MQASDPPSETGAVPAAAEADTLVLPERSAGPPTVVPTLQPDDALADPPAADDTLAQAVVLRVLAWHNRHRLVRAVRAEQVHSVGLVALPFVAKGKKGPQPSFTENFAAPLSLRALRRFAARHASAQRPGSPAWPQREVSPAGPAAAETAEQRFLITAAIQDGDRRLRLLLAPGDAGPVLGPRQWRWSPRWMAASAGATALVLALAVGGVTWWLKPGAHPPAAHAAASATHAAASAASGVATVQAQAASADHHVEAAAASASASAAAPVASAVASAPAAPEVAPVAQATEAGHAPVVPPAHAGPPGAAEAHAPATDTAAAPAPALTLPPRPTAKPDQNHARAPQPVTLASAQRDQPLDLFALVSRTAPTRAMAEHDLAGLRELLALEPHATATHLEVMPLQGRWLVVWWPFVSRAQAEHARAQWQTVVPAVAQQGWQVMTF